MSEVTSATAVGLVAAMGFAGGLLSTALLNATSSRNKFIDVITSERIKWVDKLRLDFATFLSLSLNLSSTNINKDPKEYYKIQIETSQLISLIDLKLNFESRLDQKIAGLLRDCLHIAMEETDAAKASARSTRLGIAQTNVRILTRFLLKEEWEKAKYESAGLLRRFFLAKASKRRRIVINSLLDKLPAKLPEF